MVDHTTVYKPLTATTNVVLVSTWSDNISSILNTTPPTCLVVNSSKSAPWDNSNDPISAETQVLVNSMKAMIVTPICVFLGVPTNLLSMAVFAKHGLSHRTNLCLFSLAFVDSLYGCLNFCMYVEQLGSDLLAETSGVGRLVEVIINNHLLGLHGLYWASLYISAIIAVDRCLCVMFPLQFKKLVETKTMWFVVFLGVVIITAGRFTVTEKCHVVCVYDVDTLATRSMIFASEYYLRYRHVVDAIDVVVYGLLLPLVTVTAVVIATFVTAVALKKARIWREGSSTSQLSSREIALTKMLIYLSIQFIVFNVPTILFRIICVALPEVSNYGLSYNLYFFLLGITEITAIMDTSFNFLVYVTTGSKFRETILRFFGIFHRKTTTQKDDVITSGISSLQIATRSSNV